MRRQASLLTITAIATLLASMSAARSSLGAGGSAIPAGAAKEWAEIEGQALLSISKWAISPPETSRPVTDPVQPSLGLPRKEVAEYVLQIRLRDAAGQPLLNVSEHEDVLVRVKRTGVAERDDELDACPQGYRVNFFKAKPETVDLKSGLGWNISGESSPKLDWTKATSDTSTLALSETVRGAAGAMQVAPLSPDARAGAAAEAATQAKEKEAPPPPGSPTPLPLPAACLKQCGEDLAAAKEKIQKAVTFASRFDDPLRTVRPADTALNRLSVWHDLQEGLDLLDATDGAHDRAGAAYGQLELRSRGKSSGGPDALLMPAQRPKYEAFRKGLVLAAARAVELRAEALWWQAQVEAPEAPDRQKAIDALRRGSFAASPEAAAEIKAQSDRYTKVKDEETALSQQLGKQTPGSGFILTRTTVYTLSLDVRVSKP